MTFVLISYKFLTSSTDQVYYWAANSR